MPADYHAAADADMISLATVALAAPRLHATRALRHFDLYRRPDFSGRFSSFNIADAMRSRHFDLISATVYRRDADKCDGIARISYAPAFLMSLLRAIKAALRDGARRRRRPSCRCDAYAAACHTYCRCVT